MTRVGMVVSSLLGVLILSAPLHAQVGREASPWFSFTTGLGGSGIAGDSVYRGSPHVYGRFGVGWRQSERLGLELDGTFAREAMSADCFGPCAPPFSAIGLSAGAVIAPFGGQIAGNRSLLSVGLGAYYVLPVWPAVTRVTVPGFYAAAETPPIGGKKGGVVLAVRSVVLPRVHGTTAWMLTFGIGPRVYKSE